jgi:hypothetical protein
MCFLFDAELKIMNAKIEKTLIGPAGESLVLSRLLSRGHLASAAPRGTRKIDIVVNDFENGNPKLVQVKTTMKAPSSGWQMSDKHETILDEDLFYCLVSFNNPMGSVYVIPAKVVADAVRVDHAIWLGQPGKDGKPHSLENKFRQIKPVMNGKDAGWLDEYLENWDLMVFGRPSKPVT